MTDKEAIEWIGTGYFVVLNNKLYGVRQYEGMEPNCAGQLKYLSGLCQYKEMENSEIYEKLKKRFPNNSIRPIDDTRINAQIRDLIVPLQEDDQEEEQKMIIPSVVVVDKLTYNDIVDEKLRTLIKILDGMAQSRGYLSAIKTVDTPPDLLKNTDRDYADAIHQIATFFKNNSKILIKEKQ